MDKIYPPSKFPSTEHIPLKEYFKKFSSLCTLNYDPNFFEMNEKVQHETILNTMQIKGYAERKRLAQECSIDLLTVEGENPPEEVAEPTSSSQAKVKIRDPHKIPDNAKHLKTVQVRLAYKDQLLKMYEKHKYRTEPYICQTLEKKSEEGDLIPGEHFTVTVRIYHPFDFSYSHKNSYHNLKFSHEIVALGFNTLADLRDKILCQADAGLSNEVEDPKTEVCFGDAKEKYPSGFLFIDNVFYNDTRKPESVDYSEVILQWAQEKQIQPLSVATMQSTRIDELTPRFGYPYVYQHQGKCEHVFVFSDACLLSRNHSLNCQDYPLFQSIHRFYSRLCSMCSALSARWLCTDYVRLPHSKTFICQECLLSYCYKDGKKIGKFKVYPYFDRSCML